MTFREYVDRLADVAETRVGAANMGAAFVHDATDEQAREIGAAFEGGFLHAPAEASTPVWIDYYKYRGVTILVSRQPTVEESAAAKEEAA